VVALAVILQGVALFVYHVVEERRRERGASGDFAFELVTGEPHGIDSTLRVADGKAVTLRRFEGAPVLVHFWATFCEPCRVELPKLVEASAEGRTPLLLVSVDESWDVVRHFFDGKVPPGVVLDESGSARRAFRISTLPDTYLLDAAGRPTARFHGPRDWSAPNARAELTKLVERARRDRPRSP
jgi:thiol-disulfide isomerase/thioredoxin